jgi:hypothetical protein
MDAEIDVPEQPEKPDKFLDGPGGGPAPHRLPVLETGREARRGRGPVGSRPFFVIGKGAGTGAYPWRCRPGEFGWVLHQNA